MDKFERYDVLARALTGIMKGFEHPDRDLFDGYVDNREYGLALDEIRTFIDENQLVLPPQGLLALAELDAAMDENNPDSDASVFRLASSYPDTTGDARSDTGD